MKTLKSYVSGAWHEAADGFVDLHDPCTEEVVGRASTAGIDFGAALAYARETGGPALRELTFAQRGEMLLAASKALHAQRDALIDLSLLNTGTTRKDAKFDIDGATGTLSFYAYLGKELGDRKVLLDGEGAQLGRSAKFWGQHVLVSRPGVAVHVNAFNFPAWGFAEKAACSLLAGVPAISKPATATSMLTERCIELLVEADVLPAGALSLACGRTGDLIGRLGSQDVLAFTGSADTGLMLRRGENLLRASTHVNIEADSLNAAVLGPDVDASCETWSLFLTEVVREMTQKSGQKCTAVRRIFCPKDRVDELLGALTERLADVVTGDPRDGSVSMGPLATAQQLDDAVAGVAKLVAGGAAIVSGAGERVEGASARAAGKGWFFGPTLLRADDPDAAAVVHEHEVFGPVATVMPYDGSAARAAALVARGDGTLVTSVYSDDQGFVGDYVASGGAFTGRLYLGSEKMAEQALGSGLALPQSIHGGPGRAGGGEELGGARGLSPYMQRVALQGSRSMIERLYGKPS